VNIIFFIITLLWGIVRQQVVYWVVISALGFRIETPEYFLAKEHIYHAVSWLLFIATIILSFFQTILPFWIIIIIILIIDQIVKFYARRRGCSKYRAILHEMREDCTKSNEDYSRIDKELKKTNSELLNDARKRVKLGLF
jgi:hypothetical protein